MKISPLMHIIKMIAGILGIIALVGAWTAGDGGTIYGFSQEHLYNDAHALLLMAILFAMSTVIHHRHEDGGADMM